MGAKKSYTTPRLVRYGDVAELTNGGKEEAILEEAILEEAILEEAIQERLKIISQLGKNQHLSENSEDLSSRADHN